MSPTSQNPDEEKQPKLPDPNLKRFKLHIATIDKNTPWRLHYEDWEGTRNFKNVLIAVPTATATSGDEPCANYYIFGSCHRIVETDGVACIY
jgi:hypothetical protein